LRYYKSVAGRSERKRVSETDGQTGFLTREQMTEK